MKTQLDMDKIARPLAPNAEERSPRQAATSGRCSSWRTSKSASACVRGGRPTDPAGPSGGSSAGTRTLERLEQIGKIGSMGRERRADAARALLLEKTTRSERGEAEKLVRPKQRAPMKPAESRGYERDGCLAAM